MSVFETILCTDLYNIHSLLESMKFGSENPFLLFTISQFKVSEDPTPIPPALGVPRAIPEKSRAVEVKAMNPAVHCYCRTKRWLDGR